MTSQQADNRERAVAIITEHHRLRGDLRRLDKSIAKIEAKEFRARQRGREDEALRLATERAHLEASRTMAQGELNELLQRWKFIRAQIREQADHRRNPWRSELFRNNLRWLFFISLLSITITFWMFLVLSR